MVELTSLWLPILVSAVAVYFVSFLMWMVLPHHKSDWAPLPDEKKTMDALRDYGIGAGQYSFPHCGDPPDFKSPEYQEKIERGPVGMLLVKPPGPMNMGRMMVQSFLHNLVISALVADLASTTLDRHADDLTVFRVVGVAAILGYCGAIAVNSIWFFWSWKSSLKHLVDGLAYGLVTAGVFAAMWPSPAV